MCCRCVVGVVLRVLVCAHHSMYALWLCCAVCFVCSGDRHMWCVFVVCRGGVWCVCVCVRARRRPTQLLPFRWGWICHWGDVGNRHVCNLPTGAPLSVRSAIVPGDWGLRDFQSVCATEKSVNYRMGLQLVCSQQSVSAGEAGVASNIHNVW